MKGIGRKINFGFIVLIALLIFSEALSLEELHRLSRHNRAVIERFQRQNDALRTSLERAALTDPSIEIPEPATIDIADRMDTDMRRALMPGAISLIVGIAVVLLFMFMVNTYYVRPTLLIQRRLQDYLRHNIPFNAPVEGRDELTRLKENIESLLSMQKNRE